MLRHRVIPVVLLDGYSVVKTIRFDVRRNLGNPITVARVYNARNVDELMLLDIDAAKEGRGIDLHTVEAVAAECFMPLTVGGGLKTCDEIACALKAGADKVALNTAIIDDSVFLREAVAVFGSQCIVASIDVKKNERGGYGVYSHAGKPCLFALDEFLARVVEAGAGEVLLNNVDLDGTMAGYDQALIKYVAARISMPIIAAGGASGEDDCVLAIRSGASAVSAASIFHFTSITPRTCKEAMAKEGLPVRL